MLSRTLAATLAGVVLMSASAQAGDDVIRLVKKGSDNPIRLVKADTADTLSLLATNDDLDADTLDVGWRGGWRGGWGGGWRGGWGGGVAWGGGWRGGWGGYRGGWGWGGGWRGGWGGGWGGGWRGGVAWGGGWRGGWGGGWGGGWRGGWRGISDDGFDAYVYPLCHRTVVSRSIVITPSPSYSEQPMMPRSGGMLPAPTPIPQMPRADEGTYPYDGGPMNPIPMPKQEAKPTIVPFDQVYPEERFVSLVPSAPSLLKVKDEQKTGKWTYPAYGEAPRRSK